MVEWFHANKARHSAIMQSASLPPDIRSLPVTERLALAELIWDSIVDDGGSMEFSEAQKAELDRRLELRNLERASSWDEVKRRIQGRA